MDSLERIARPASRGTALTAAAIPLVALLAFAGPVARAAGEPAAAPADAPYRNASLPVERRVDDLLARMTTEEKLAQVTQLGCGRNTTPNNWDVKVGETRVNAALAGGFILFPEAAGPRDRLQKRAVETTRLGIPAIFGSDVIHGHATCFPQPIAQACTFDTDLIRRACTAIAVESKASGTDWTFAPLCDVSRDPRWGRMVETFGEDTYLVGEMSAASVRGYQAPILGRTFGIAACTKHFVGYGASEAGIDYAATEISDQTMQDVYLPPFKAALDAGAKTVMSGFNNVGGVPMTGNRHLLTDVLRGQLDFRGFVVSDYSGPLQLGPDYAAMAADKAECARLALHAGVDMDMMDGVYAGEIGRAIDAKTVPAAELDEAVRRILRVKFECGLFEHPYAPEVPADRRLLQPGTRALARDVAAESLVLLKNEKAVLPLSAGIRSVALIGPFADDKDDQNGAWSQFSSQYKALNITIREALTAALKDRARVDYVKGCRAYEGAADRDAVLKAVAGADVVVLCLGDARNGENTSRCSLDLPPAQAELADLCFDAGKPVVLLMTCGKPVIINRQAKRADAVMMVWQGGIEAGAAIADALTGAVSPSGRLSFSWPRHQGQIPIYYSRRRTNRPYAPDKVWSSHYQDESLDPLYPFGAGLSYAAFDYGKIRLSADKLSGPGRLTAEVDVTNRSAFPAAQSVLWYLAPSHGRITRPIKLLKNFGRRLIAPGETTTFRFEIDPDRDLSYPDASGKKILEAASYTLNVNDSTEGNALGSVKFSYKP